MLHQHRLPASPPSILGPDRASHHLFLLPHPCFLFLSSSVLHSYVAATYIELMIFEQPPFWEERFEHFKWTNVLFINREWLDAIDGMKSVGEGGGGWTFNRQDALRECSPGLNKISKARPTM